MAYRVIYAFKGVLLYKVSRKLLHLLDNDTYQLLLALKNGEKKEDICRYSEDINLCLSNLILLENTWSNISLLTKSNLESLKLTIVLKLSNEFVKVHSNSSKVMDFLSNHYSNKFKLVDKHQISSEIKITQDLDDKTFSIYIDDEVLYEKLLFQQAIFRLFFELGEIATNEKPRLFVAHAAGVVKDKFSILFPASAGSGKTTLTSYLINHGYKLINDDVIPINFDGSATCIHSPLKIKKGSWPVLNDMYPELLNIEVFRRSDNQLMKFLATDESQNAQAGKEYTVNALVIPEYSPNFKTSFTELRDDQKLKYFLESTPHLPHKFTRTYIKEICDWLETKRTWRLEYSDMHEAKIKLDELQLINNAE